MTSQKRIVIGTIAGIIAGFFCIAGGILVFGMTFTPLGVLFVLSNRALIGFVITISSLKLPWAIHGALIGLIVGFPFPVYDLIIGQGPVVSLAAFIMGPVFGVMIEYVTSIVFKAGRS